MRKGLIFLLGVICLLGCLLPGQAAEAKAIDEVPNVAILSFPNNTPTKWDDFDSYASQAAEDLGMELKHSNRFHTKERDELQALLDEQSLSLTGLVRRDTMTKLGQLDGIDYAVLGSVTSLTSKRSSGGFQKTGNTNGGVAMRRYKVSATVMVRMVDVRTGDIVLYGRGTAHSDSTMTAANLSGNFVHFGTEDVSEEQCASAIRKAVHDAVYGKEGIITELDGEN